MRRRCPPLCTALEPRVLFVSYAVTFVQNAAGTGIFGREGGIDVSGLWITGNFNDASALHSYLAGGSKKTSVVLKQLSGDNYTEVHHLNGKGQAVGISYNSGLGNVDDSAVLWDSTGKVTRLGSGEANSINNAGTVVGVYNNRAVRYSKGKATNLPNLGGSISLANDINSAGVIVGTSNTTGDAAREPFIYDGKHVINLTPNAQTGEGFAINDAGVAVGQMNLSKAFVYQNGVATALPSISNFFSSAMAVDINNGNEIVGTSEGTGASAATLWTGGKVYNLNSLVTDKTVTLSQALSITDRGEILAYGTKNFQQGTFLLTPIRSSLNSKGTLSISGTDGADVISLSKKGSKITVTINGLGQAFTTSKVKRISIAGLGGNDKITVGSGVKGCSIDAGSGNDTVSGGDGADTIIGGDGKDKLAGGAGNDSISGGNSNDILTGGTGADTLNGGAGKDSTDKDSKDKRIADEVLT